MTAPAVDGARLLSRLARFAEIGGTPAGGVDRQALSPEDRRARALLAELAKARGFSVHQDLMANLFLRREGAEPDAAPVLIGSHLDSQPTGGRFDGALGVIAALECLEALEDAGVETVRPVEVVAWTNEEGSRFSPGAMGSQAFSAGAMPAAWTAAVDASGISLEAELRATVAALPHAVLRPLGTALAAYVELHLEQGPVLERDGLPIGVVTGIQGTRWLDVELIGRAAHAGTTPLAFRRDPMAAAAAAWSSLYDTLMPRDPDARFTVGRVDVEPGSVNAIPARVAFSVDLRHPSATRLDAMEAAVIEACRAAATRHGCSVAVDRSVDMPPAAFPEAMLATIEAAAEACAARHRRLVSGAFHDALFLARVGPSAMIFVPCRGGLSHNEAEFVEDEHAVAGARVLLAATLRLAGGADTSGH